MAGSGALQQTQQLTEELDRYPSPPGCPVCGHKMAKGTNWYDIGEMRTIVWYCYNRTCSHGSKNRSAGPTPQISGGHCA